MMAPRINRSKNRDGSSCPVCNTDLADESTARRVENELGRMVNTRVRESARIQSEKYREMLKEQKMQQKMDLQNIRTLDAERHRQLKDRMAAEARKDKEANRTALVKLKAAYQERQQNLRDAYDREKLQMQKDGESSFNARLQEIIQNYGALASSHQEELGRLKRVHDQNDALMRKKDSEISRLKIELAKSSSRLELKELMLQLHERDDTIEKLNGRIRELEGRVVQQQRLSPPAAKEPQKPLTEDEQKEKLKEYMRAIIEITRSQQAEKKRAEPVRHGEKEKVELGDNSKVDKILGWFF